MTVRAQPWARAVYAMLQHQGAFEREQCCQRSGRRAAEPGASLDTEGMNLHEARDTASSTAALHATAPRGHEPLSPAPLLGHPLALLWDAALVAHGLRGLLLTRAWCSLDNVNALSPLFAEDGRRAQRHCSVAERSQARLCTRRPRRRVHRKTCVGPPRAVALSYGTHVSTRPRLLTTPGRQRRGKKQNTALRSSLSLDKRGPHTCSAWDGSDTPWHLLPAVALLAPPERLAFPYARGPPPALSPARKSRTARASSSL